MTVALLWIGAGLAAAVVTHRVATAGFARAPARRRNYRGLELPSVSGVAVVLGILAGLGVVAVVRALTGVTSERMLEAALWNVPAAAAVLGFGFVGLWDDLSEPGSGWRAHLGSLRRGIPTGGAVKLAGGVLVALIVATPTQATIWWALGNGAIIALSANMFNLLDARPGRASKVFLIAVVPFLVVGGPVGPLMAAGAGAALAFLPLDLRERAMLGDVGANAMGALVGLGVVIVGSDAARLVALVLLAGAHVVGERPGLSRVIERVPPLRAFDLVGRIPD